jgi:hypothetical protein
MHTVARMERSAIRVSLRARRNFRYPRVLYRPDGDRFDYRFKRG